MNNGHRGEAVILPMIETKRFPAVFSYEDDVQ